MEDTTIQTTLSKALDSLDQEELFLLAKAGNLHAIQHLKRIRQDLEGMLSTNAGWLMLGRAGTVMAWDKVERITDLLSSLPMIGKTEQAKHADALEIIDLAEAVEEQRRTF